MPGPPTVIPNDVYFNGDVQFSAAVGFPNASLGDAQINASNPLGVTKTIHRTFGEYSQPHGTAATTERRVIHRAKAAGTITSFLTGPVVAAAGAATVTANLLKNGASVLTAVATINSGTAAFASVVASITTATYVAGDVFEVSLTATAGGGTLPQGVFAQGIFDEQP